MRCCLIAIEHARNDKGLTSEDLAERMGELLALKWEDIDFSTAQLHVRRTINRLAKYEAHDGENKTEIVFGTPKTKNSRRTIPLARTMADELARWKQ